MLSKYIENVKNIDIDWTRGLWRCLQGVNFNHYSFFNCKNENNSDLQDVLNLFPINNHNFKSIVADKFITPSNKRIYDLFICSDKLVGINIKGIKSYITRGIITDQNLKIKLSVMIKPECINQVLFKTEDIIVLVHRDLYISKSNQDPLTRIIKNIVNDCIDNGLEVRIVDNIQCFAIPDVYTTEIGNKVNKRLLETIELKY
jgi:hypothetical protein